MQNASFNSRKAAIEKMKNQRALHAVYGLKFPTREEMAMTDDEIKCFDSYQHLMEWCDLLPKIYKDLEQPTHVYAVHVI